MFGINLKANLLELKIGNFYQKFIKNFVMTI